MFEDKVAELAKMGLADADLMAKTGRNMCIIQGMKFMKERPPYRVDKRLIAFSGPKESGKDTAAAMTSKTLAAYNPVKLPFAGSVKQVVSTTFNIPLQVFEDPIAKETPLTSYPYVTPRKLLQDVANTFRILFGADVWVNAWLQALMEQRRAGVFLVTDLRFPNEISMIQELGGAVIYIQRPEAEAKLAQQVAEGNSLALNASESHWPEIKRRANFILDNSAGLDNLQNAVDHVLQRI